MRRTAHVQTSRRRRAARAPALPVRALLDAASEGLALVTVEGRIEYANAAFGRLMHLRKGRSLLEAISPDRRERVAELLAKREGRIEISVEAAMTLRPAPDPDFVCVSIVDLSERRKREDVIESTRLTRAVLQNAAEPILVLNSKGRILRCSRAAIDLSGTNPSLHPFEDAYPLVVDPRRGELELWTGSSILMALQWGQSLKSVPVTLTRRDGRRFHLLLSATAMRDPQGRIERAVVSLTDATEQRKIEERLRFLSEAGEVLASSLDVEASLEKLAQALVPRIADRCAIRLAGRRFAAPPDARLPEPLPRPTISRSFICVPLSARDSALGHLLLESDHEFAPAEFDLARELARRISTAIDRAQLYREAKEAVRIREEFLSMASHELRTPLTSLTLVLGIMQRMKDPAKLLDLVPEAKRHAGSIARLISDLLDVSKMISRRLEIVPERTDLAAIAREAAERLGGGVRVRAPRTVPGQWDRLRLDQVATNLISNAIKYGEGRPIDVRVARAKGEALFEVRDHGRGIEAEALPHLFEPFHRAASAKGVPGLGMGLYVTRQIVEAHGGRIEIASRPGHGTTVRVTLPR